MQEQSEIPKRFTCHFTGKIMIHPVKVIRRKKNVSFKDEEIVCEHEIFHQKFSMELADSHYLKELKNEISDFLELHPQYKANVFVSHKKAFASSTNKKISWSELLNYFCFLKKICCKDNSNQDLSEKTPLLIKTPH